MQLGKAVKAAGGQVGYVASAAVYHIHDETWPQVRRRYEREAFALATIAPEIAMTFRSFCACVLRSIAKDVSRAHSRNYFYPDRQYEQEVPGNDNNRSAAYEGPQQSRSW